MSTEDNQGSSSSNEENTGSFNENVGQILDLSTTLIENEGNTGSFNGNIGQILDLSTALTGNEENTRSFNGNISQILDLSTALTENNNQSEPATVRRPDAEAYKFFLDTLAKINGLRGTYDHDIIVVRNSLEKLRDNPYDDDRCSAALDDIMALVDHIDVATDFVKLGGLITVGQFLNSGNREIIRLAAEVIGVASQNHPLCQEAVLTDKNIFSGLFSILRSTKYEDNVKLKAVFALSSIVQNNKACLDKFVELNGYDVFINILKTATIPLKLRTCFVIDCMCSQFPQIKSTLLEKDYISCLIDLLTKIPLGDSKETVLSAMLSLVEGCYDAIEECKKEEYNLIATLDYLIAHYKDNAEEEKQKALKLKGELDRFSKASR